MSGLFGGGKQPSAVSNTAPIVASLRVQTSALGRGIPIGFGMARVAGNVIWYGDLTPIAHSEAVAGGSGGKGGGGGSPPDRIFYTYTAAILLTLGRGPIAGVSRVWKDKEKTSLAALGLSLYTGDGVQTAFPHLTTNHPAEALAYRRLAYVASAALDLGEDTRLGNYNFEVSSPPQRGSTSQVGKTFTTGTLSTDTLTFAAHGFNQNDAVTASSSGTLPPPLAPLTTYFVVSPTANGLKLAATQNGAPIVITGSGSGAHLLAEVVFEENMQVADFFTVNLFTVQFNSTAHGYAPNTIGRVSSSGTLPAGPGGLAAGVDYYVIEPTTNNFKLSAIPGGEPIAVFSAGSGTHTVIRWVPDADPKDVVEQLLLRAGVDASRIGDLSAFSNYCVANGIFVSAVYTEPTPTFDLIRDLAAIGNSEVVPSEDKIKIVPYSDAAATGNGVTYTPNNTPLFEFNDDHFLAEGDECPVEIDDGEPADAWNVVKVKYYNRERDYNEDVAEAQDDDHIALFGRRPMPEPVALYGIVDPAVARFVAQVILQNKLYFHCGYRFRLPPGKAELLEPMDLITITDARLGLSAFPVRIMKIEEIEGDRQEGFTFHVREFPAGVASPVLYPAQLGGGFTADFNVAPGDTNAPVILDAPGALTVGGFELWIAASGGPNWGGAQIWVATDSGGPFKQVGSIFGRSRHGVLSATFPSGSDPDTVNTAAVDLTVSRGSLTGGTQADADEESTLSVVDGELISFEDATLTAQYQYDLETYLRRGLHGTPVGAHSAGAPFVRLDQALGRTVYEAAQVGTPIFIKLPAFNSFGAAPQDLSAVSAFTHTIQGSIGRPENVTGYSASQNGAVAVFQWQQVVRDLHHLKGYELRYLPKLAQAATEADWLNATPLTRVTRGTQITTAKLPPGNWTTFIKAADYSEKQSTIAATYDVEMVSTFDLIEQAEEPQDWLGTKTNFLKHWTNVLVPDSTKAADELTNAELFEQFVPYPFAVCEYQAPEIDLTVDGDTRIWADMQSALGRGRTGLADPQLEIDHKLSAGAYDGFEPWTIGNVNARFVKGKLVLTTDDGVCFISSFKLVADAEERVEEGQVVLAAGGSIVVFAQPFRKLPSVALFNTDAAARITTVEDVTTTQFEGHSWNTSNSDVGGNARYEATGA